MPDNGLVTSKVRAYMEALSPAARSLLLRAVQTGEADGGLPLPARVLKEALAEFCVEPTAPAASLQGSQDDPVLRRERIEKIFLEPIAPFLIDVELPVKQVGRIYGGSVRAIWTWILRDVAHREYEQAIALDPGDGDADPSPIARRFRREAVALMLTALRAAETDPRGWHRLQAQLGGDAVLRDLRDVLYVLQREPQIASFLAQAPKSVAAADVAEGAGCFGLIRASVEKVQLDATFLGSALLSRVTAPWLNATLAARLAGTTDPKLVQSSRYGGLVDIALSEADRFVELVRRDLRVRRDRQKVLGWVRAFHEDVRNVRVILEVEGSPVWLKRLAASRKALSDLLGHEIESAPGRVRRALRSETIDGDFGGRFDPDSLEDAEFAVRLLGEARIALDSLALNEVVKRTRAQVEQTLEVSTAKLFADLKANQALDRRGIIAAVDGAIRLSALVFGDDYAATLRKSRDLALNKQQAKAG